MKKLLSFTFAALLFFGCKKEDQDATSVFTYTSGTNGNMYFTNLSEHANNYLWNFGDGTTSTEVNPTHQYTSNGSYSVSLTSQGAKSVSSTQVINISNVTAPATSGQAIFWTATNQYGQIIVKVNGGNVGTVTQYTTNGLAPECGTNGFVTIDRPAGTYTVTAESADGNWTWNTTVVITNGVCTKKQFT